MTYIYEQPKFEVGEIDFVPADHLRISTDISKAKEGDKEAAHRILQRFVNSVENNDPLDDRIVDFITKSFNKALKGVSLDKAFGLVRPEGRPASATKWRKYREYYGYVLEETRVGSTYEDAVSDAADHFKVSETTVKRAFGIMKNLHREIIKNSRPFTEDDRVAIQSLVKSSDP